MSYTVGTLVFMLAPERVVCERNLSEGFGVRGSFRPVTLYTESLSLSLTFKK